MNNEEIFKLIELKTRQIEALSKDGGSSAMLLITIIKQEINNLELQLK